MIILNTLLNKNQSRTWLVFLLYIKATPSFFYYIKNKQFTNMSNEKKITVSKTDNKVNLSWKVTQDNKDLVFNDNDKLTLSINDNEEDVKGLESKEINVNEDTYVNISLTRNGKIVRTDNIFIDYDETSDDEGGEGGEGGGDVGPSAPEYAYYGSLKIYDGDNTEITWQEELKTITTDHINSWDVNIEEVSDFDVAPGGTVLKYSIGSVNTEDPVNTTYELYTADEEFDQSQIIIMYPEVLGDVNISIIDTNDTQLQTINVYDESNDEGETGFYKMSKEIDNVTYTVLVQKQITSVMADGLIPPIRLKTTPKEN